VVKAYILFLIRQGLKFAAASIIGDNESKQVMVMLLRK